MWDTSKPWITLDTSTAGRVDVASSTYFAHVCDDGKTLTMPLYFIWLHPGRMTVRIADLHLTFAPTIWRQSPDPSTMEYRSSFAALDANHPSCTLMKGYESPVSRFEIVTNAPNEPFFHSEKPASVSLDSSICLSHFVKVLGVALELDQSPKTL